MDLNAIKKSLCLAKPTATRVATVGDEGEIWVYETRLNGRVLTFFVPESDMGGKLFDKYIPAQLLIRWINA